MTAAAQSTSPCRDCGGTGFVLVQHEGQAAARRCRCQQVARQRVRLAAAQIPVRYQHCTLESFDRLTSSLASTAARAQRFYDEFPAGGRGILFRGPCGTGKTHLAVALLRKLIEEKGAAGHFAEFTHLIRKIQDSFDRRAQTPSFAVLQPALDADVLVLDDLGAMNVTPWVRDTLGLIVNERYNANRTTLFTTNVDDSPGTGEEGLKDRIGERLASRLVEMCWEVRVDAEDYRRKYRAAGLG